MFGNRKKVEGEGVSCPCLRHNSLCLRQWASPILPVLAPKGGHLGLGQAALPPPNISLLFREDVVGGGELHLFLTTLSLERVVRIKATQPPLKEGFSLVTLKVTSGSSVGSPPSGGDPTPGLLKDFMPLPLYERLLTIYLRQSLPSRAPLGFFGSDFPYIRP